MRADEQLGAFKWAYREEERTFWIINHAQKFSISIEPIESSANVVRRENEIE